MSGRALPISGRLIEKVPSPPLVSLRLGPDEREIQVKLEFLNPGGSTKDRIARHTLEKAWRRGDLGPGSSVVETARRLGPGASVVTVRPDRMERSFSTELFA